MTIEIVDAAGAQAVVRNLFVPYMHELSDMAGLDVQEDGTFAFPPSFAAYWDGAAGRHPFLVRADEKLAGFALIRQLAANGFLHHDVAGFGGLSLTEDGRAVLRGEKPFLCRVDAARGVARKDRAAQTASALTDEQAALLAALKKLRLSLAARRHLPAYLIFSDKTLIEMARSTPRNLREFAMVSGVGTSKLRDFGQVFVDAIAAHCGAAA